MAKGGRITLEEVNRKLDIILGVLVDPKHVQDVQAGKSLDNVLLDEAARLATVTGDFGYIRDYQKSKVARRQGAT